MVERRDFKKTLTGILWASFISEVALEGGDCKDGPVWCYLGRGGKQGACLRAFSPISWDLNRAVEFPLSFALLNITHCDKNSWLYEFISHTFPSEYAPSPCCWVCLSFCALCFLVSGGYQRRAQNPSRTLLTGQGAACVDPSRMLLW